MVNKTWQKEKETLRFIFRKRIEKKYFGKEKNYNLWIHSYGSVLLRYGSSVQYLMNPDCYESYNFFKLDRKCRIAFVFGFNSLLYVCSPRHKQNLKVFGLNV